MLSVNNSNYLQLGNVLIDCLLTSSRKAELLGAIKIYLDSFTQLNTFQKEIMQNLALRVLKRLI